MRPRGYIAGTARAFTAESETSTCNVIPGKPMANAYANTYLADRISRPMNRNPPQVRRRFLFAASLLRRIVKHGGSASTA